MFGIFSYFIYGIYDYHFIPKWRITSMPNRENVITNTNFFGDKCYTRAEVENLAMGYGALGLKDC